VVLLTADVNQDGKTDLIFAKPYDNTLSVLTNNGSGDLVLSATLITGNGPYTIAAGDVNGNGPFRTDPFIYSHTRASRERHGIVIGTPASLEKQGVHR
jgi:Fe-S cluster assembly ATPase SufC